MLTPEKVLVGGRGIDWQQTRPQMVDNVAAHFSTLSVALVILSELPCLSRC